jgi:hypothetical protein
VNVHEVAVYVNDGTGETVRLSAEGCAIAALMMLHANRGAVRLEPRTTIVDSHAVNGPVRTLCSMRIELGFDAWAWGEYRPRPWCRTCGGSGWITGHGFDGPWRDACDCVGPR